MPECLVIGGGLAGAMAGLRLAAAGREVTLMERERTAHHKVCGEFLSPESVLYLRTAGIDPLQLGAAPVRRLRLSVSARAIETELPFTALSLSRCVLDEALLKRAADVGCTVIRGRAVQKLEPKRGFWTAHGNNGEAICASTVFLATGKHDLRGWPRPAGRQNDLVGFKLHWKLAPTQTRALAETMELFLFRGGYGGLCLVEQQMANLCLVVRRSILRRYGTWPALLTAILAENRRMRVLLEGAEPAWARPLAVSSIPYGMLLCDNSEPGLWRIGDQAAVIPSFTGDGMSIALHSAALAASVYLRGGRPAEYEQPLAAQLKSGMKLATWLSRGAVSPVAARMALVAFALFPQGLRLIASATRIPSESLLVAPACATEEWQAAS